MIFSVLGILFIHSISSNHYNNHKIALFVAEVDPLSFQVANSNFYSHQEQQDPFTNKLQWFAERKLGKYVFVLVKADNSFFLCF